MSFLLKIFEEKFMMTQTFEMSSQKINSKDQIGKNRHHLPLALQKKKTKLKVFHPIIININIFSLRF